VRYSILGPTRAHRDDGTAVPLGGARLRALLAALALRPGRAVPAETLIDEVWDGDPPADAAGALQALVARLRRALGHDAVGLGEGGYRLRAVGADVDLHRFERLVADGGRALSDGDPAKAAALLADALAAWGGPPLADLPGRTGYAARYDVLHDDAVRLRLTAELELGRAERILPELAAICAGQPLNEPLQTLHIRALRDAGRTADALDVYGTVRAAIAERLGVEPGPALRALYGELLDADHGPVRPPGRVAAYGAGGPDGGPDGGGGGGAGPGAPAAAAERTSGNLRARLTSFVGREAELRALGADLGTARLVTLIGPGGSGKTRLSQEAAERCAGRWPDGVWLAELAPVADGATVPEALLNALGLREIAIHAGADKTVLAGEREQDPVRVLTDFCTGRRLLLVLDNCEHIIEACATLAELLLVRCPGVTVLATSREPLNVPGELVRPVDPLPREPALRLLADRGAAARPGFDVAEDPAACAEICRRLDGLPLAIELAAARLRSMTPRQIAGRLDDRFRLLTAGSRTVLPRQQTLWAVVDWSWELLEEAERAVLRRLSVFSGGCDLTAAEQVCSADGVEPADVAAVLGSLVDKSLVLADLGGETARYRMLETIGEYAAKRLEESGERAATCARHVAYFREYARTADPYLRGPQQVRWLDRFEREHDNLRAALRRAVDAGDEPEALQLALSCVWFWLLRNYRTELHHWLKAVADLGPDPFAEPRPEPVPLERTPLDMPLPLPPEYLVEARRWVRTSALMALEEGLDELVRGGDVTLGQAIADAYPPHLPQSSLRPGLIRPFAAFLMGDFERMPPLLDELVDTCRAHGRVWELAFALQLRAKAMNDATEPTTDAMADVRESRELFARVGDRWGLAEALSGEAETAGTRGDWATTVRCCREATDLARELGAHQQVPELTVRLGEALINAGEPVEGERLLRAGVEEGKRLGPGTQGAVFYGRINLVAVLGARGDLAEAHELLDEMTSDGQPLVHELARGLLRSVRGWLVARGGDPPAGLRMAREGFEELYEHPLAAIFVPRLGVLLIPVVCSIVARAAEADADGDPAVRRRRARDGAMLLGAYASLRRGAVARLEQAELAAAEPRLRAVLGEGEFAAARAEGAGLTPEEAVALARTACR
jgi:predicted ATPase/DNA-binding SARP family transcriptional activator